MSELTYYNTEDPQDPCYGCKQCGKCPGEKCSMYYHCQGCGGYSQTIGREEEQEELYS